VEAQGCVVRAGEFYRAYQDWCDDYGLKNQERLSNTKFGRLMTQRFDKKENASGNCYGGVGLAAMGGRGAGAEPLEGSVSGDPPFSHSSSIQQLSRENQNNPPLPSTEPSPVSENPPLNPPPALPDPPRCSVCNVPMSSARVRDVCGRCQR
jgi:hypothetical protein